MAATAFRVPDRDMSVGRVFERAFSTIGHNLPVTLGIALVFGAVPGTLLAWGMSVAQRSAFEDGPFLTGFWILTLLSWIVGLVISALVQAVLTRATVAESEGRRASLTECLRAAFAVILPLIGLSILLAIGVGIGFVFLFVPGVMLYIAWSVAAPALIEERRGVAGSFHRSWDLTRGARWKVFAILLVLFIIYYLLSGVVGLFAMWSLGTARLTSFGDFTIGFVILNLLLGLVVNLLWGTVQASLYVELRGWKDGPSTENLEEVFA